MKRKLRQKGVIFLALVLVLIVTGSTLALSALNNRQTSEIAAQKELHFQMSLAKQALLAYAANSARLNNDTRGPGFLPCPDTDAPTAVGAGEPQSTCNSNTPRIGRLPEYEMFSGSRFPFNSAYADIDQQFWYVVAPRYVYHTTTASNRRSRLRTNSTYASPYWLALDGLTQLESEYVAFIIAPGDELETQDRSGGPTNYANYLDGLNGASSFNYYTSYSANPELFNDQILGITLDEYMVVVGAAVASEVKKEMDEYAALLVDYPADSGSIASTTCNGTTGTTFSNLFDDEHIWLRDASLSTNGNNTERWSCPSGVYWNRTVTSPSTPRGELKFNGCTNLTFTITYGSETTRTGTGC